MARGLRCREITRIFGKMGSLEARFASRVGNLTPRGGAPVSVASRALRFGQFAQAVRAVAGEDRPRLAKHIVHIVGTNGKGTTASALAEFLRLGGRRVVRFTSPHLVNLSERFWINGEHLEQSELLRMYSRVEPTVERYDLGHFETITLLLVQWMLERAGQVDALVLEAGVGGRWDPTTCLARDTLLLTTLARDHESVLGSSLDEIRTEKRGALERVERSLGLCTPALEWGEPVVGVAPPKVRFTEGETWAQIIDGQWSRMGVFGQPAAHCVALAARAFEVIEGTPIRADWPEQIRWPGRFQVVPGEVTWILSGDHNSEGFAVLKRNWVDWWRCRTAPQAQPQTIALIVVLTGVKLDRSGPQQPAVLPGVVELASTIMLESQDPHLDIILTTPQFRSAGEDQLAEAAKQIRRAIHDRGQGNCRVEYVADVTGAFGIAVSRRPDVALATGSIYGIGELTGLMNLQVPEDSGSSRR